MLSHHTNNHVFSRLLWLISGHRQGYGSSRWSYRRRSSERDEPKESTKKKGPHRSEVLPLNYKNHSQLFLDGLNSVGIITPIPSRFICINTLRRNIDRTIVCVIKNIWPHYRRRNRYRRRCLCFYNNTR